MLLVEILLFVYGIVLLSTGRLQLGSSRTLRGPAVRVAGLCFLLQLPVAFLSGFVAGYLQARAGRSFDVQRFAAEFIPIELGIVLVCVVLGIVVLTLGASSVRSGETEVKPFRPRQEIPEALPVLDPQPVEVLPVAEVVPTAPVTTGFAPAAAQQPARPVPPPLAPPRPVPRIAPPSPGVSAAALVAVIAVLAFFGTMTGMVYFWIKASDFEEKYNTERQAVRPGPVEKPRNRADEEALREAELARLAVQQAEVQRARNERELVEVRRNEHLLAARILDAETQARKAMEGRQEAETRAQRARTAEQEAQRTITQLRESEAQARQEVARLRAAPQPTEKEKPGAAESARYNLRLARAVREQQAKNHERAAEELDACPVALRGWEWRYLRALCEVGPEARFDGDPLTFPTKDVQEVVFSGDSRLLMVVGRVSRTVRILEIPSGKERLALDFTGSLTGHSLSPDGKRLAVCVDGSVHLYDLERRERIEEFTKLKWRAAFVAFSADGQRLATLVWEPGNRTVVKVWDLAEKKAVFTSTDDFSGGTCVVCSRDGKRVAAALRDRVAVWDVESGKLNCTFMENETGCLAFSPNGKRLAMGRRLFGLVVWEVEGDKRMLTIPQQGKVWSLAFDPEGKVLAAGTQDRRVDCWDATTGRQLATFAKLAQVPRGVAFSPDGKWLAWGAYNAPAKEGEIKLLARTVPKAKPTAVLLCEESPRSITGLAFARDGKRLAALDNYSITIRDTETGKVLRTLKGHTEILRSVAWSPDGKRLASTASSWRNVKGKLGEVKVWDGETGAEVKALTGHTLPAAGVEWSKNGRFLIGYSTLLRNGEKNGESEIVLWDADTGKVEKRQDYPGELHGISQAADGTGLVTFGVRADLTSELVTWTVPALARGRAVTGPRNSASIQRVALSPTSPFVAVLDGFATTFVLSRTSGETLLRLARGRDREAPDLAFSPDGRRLAVAGKDGAVRLYDSATWEEVFALSPALGLGRHVAFSPDGSRLAVSSGFPRGEIRIWTAPTK